MSRPFLGPRRSSTEWLQQFLMFGPQCWLSRCSWCSVGAPALVAPPPGFALAVGSLQPLPIPG
eukprot:11308830-Alexandrium_andersonii.AAC.1